MRGVGLEVARDGQERGQAQDGKGVQEREDRTLNGFELRRWAWSGRDGLELLELVAALRLDLRWGSCAFRNPPENANRFWDAYGAGAV